MDRTTEESGRAFAHEQSVGSPDARPFDLRRLVGAWRRQPDYLVAAQYGTTTGAPAIFPRWSFRELGELRGDRGSGALLQRHADRVVRVPIAAAALDVDTPEDLLLLERQAEGAGRT